MELLSCYPVTDWCQTKLFSIKVRIKLADFLRRLKSNVNIYLIITNIKKKIYIFVYFQNMIFLICISIDSGKLILLCYTWSITVRFFRDVWTIILKLDDRTAKRKLNTYCTSKLKHFLRPWSVMKVQLF